MGKGIEQTTPRITAKNATEGQTLSKTGMDVLSGASVADATAKLMDCVHEHRKNEKQSHYESPALHVQKVLQSAGIKRDDAVTPEELQKKLKEAKEKLAQKPDTTPAQQRQKAPRQ